MHIYKCLQKCLLFPHFFWFSNLILSDALILPTSQLQTQQVMTSQIRSHIEYIIQTYYILVLIFVVEIDEKSSHNGEFKYDLMMISYSCLLFVGHLYSLHFRIVTGGESEPRSAPCFP